MASPIETDLRGSVGAALRQVRTARMLSLQDVAKGTGISASFLSMVEKDRSDITIGRLVKLIDFYGISLTDLLPLSAATEYPEVVEPGARKPLHSPAEGISISLLAVDTQRQLMPLEVEFEPARKAHLGLRVAPGELNDLADRLAGAGAPVTWDEDLPGERRFYSADPWGNRIEFLAKA